MVPDQGRSFAGDTFQSSTSMSNMLSLRVTVVESVTRSPESPSDVDDGDTRYLLLHSHLFWVSTASETVRTRYPVDIETPRAPG